MTYKDSANNNHLGIGYLYIQLLKQGIFDFDAIATELQKMREAMELENNYCYDKFIQNGSDSQGIIKDNFHEDGEKIVYCVNHYLGLNRHPKVIEASINALKKYGTGCGTSAVSGGRSQLHYELEKSIAEFLGKESVLLFPTGYTTNLGVVSGLCQRGNIIFADSEVHASIIDGIKLSKAKRFFFEHNNLDDLARKLDQHKNHDGNKIVILESAYSMSGDLAPLKEIVELKREHNFYLYLDEAHTFGFCGKRGRGLASEMGVLDEVDFFVSTLSKSCASIGGFVATKEKYKTLLMCKSNPYLFQACISPADVATVKASLEIIKSDDSLAKDLHAKNRYMRAKLTKLGFDLGNSKSPIIPIFIPDVEKLEAFGKDLYKKGIFAVNIIFPAVSPTDGRIRLIINTSHTYEQLDMTADILSELGRKYNLLTS